METKNVEAAPMKNLSELQIRSIIGTDERIIVMNTKEAPYNSITFIAVDGAVGSGAVIGKNTVLTAAHVVKNIRNNPTKDSIYVVPGRDGSSVPYSKFKIKAVHIPQSYIEKPSVDTDIAVITVDTLDGKSIGDIVPILPYKLTNTVEVGTDLVTAGYPGDKPWGTMWTSKGNSLDQTKTRIYYNMDTAGGQSGSPIYNLNNEIIAVHTTGAGNKNFGTKLNDEYYQFVSENIS
ncbi:MAG: trypsin-like peptidase domain-containing protein [Enterococcus lacertideformus]|uniref:Serine protease n=1 Tax=Enterococcus lacertideformus TaxID=2771493 RepID=A0A931F9B2_9ENTE|nr:trypsin-like peptidase domain-containing protein [Enterococcus lacertideformus]